MKSYPHPQATLHSAAKWSAITTKIALCELHYLIKLNNPTSLTLPVCCVQMQEVLQDGVQKLEQHPDHQEDVPTGPEVTDLLEKAQKLLQLKDAGNKWVPCCIKRLNSYGSAYVCLQPALSRAKLVRFNAACVNVLSSLWFFCVVPNCAMEPCAVEFCRQSCC